MPALSDFAAAGGAAGHLPPGYGAAATIGPALAVAAGRKRCDVCIIGGGYTGLSAALHLAGAGYNVCLAEAERVGFGASGRNGGQVGMGQRRDQNALERMLGKADARRLWDLASDAVALVRDLAGNAAMKCRFTPGLLHADHRRRFVRHSHDYVKKLNEEYDYRLIRGVDEAEMRHLVRSPAYFGGALDLGGGHLNPLDFALGLARMAIAAGAAIHEGSRVLRIVRGTPAHIITGQAEIIADHVILACNGYLDRLDTQIAAYVMPINNYSAATRILTPDERHGLLTEDYAVADSRFVVNYFRVSEDGRFLFGGGESSGPCSAAQAAAMVRKSMVMIFPQLAEMPIDHVWGGTLAITMFRLPYFRRMAGNILTFCGYSGHGVALATLAGKIAAEAIAGQSARFDLMAQIPAQPFPGGIAGRRPLLALAMMWYGLRDRI